MSALVATAAFAQTPAPAGWRRPIPTSPARLRQAGRPSGQPVERSAKARLAKEYVAYTDCLKRFIADQKALAGPHLRGFQRRGRRATNDGVQEVQRSDDRKGAQQLVIAARGRLPAPTDARRRPPRHRSAPSRDDPALAIARVLREGFNRHYALFRECARAAKRYFEAAQLARDRPRRPRPDRFLRPPRARRPSSASSASSARAGLDGGGAEALWERVKLHFIGLLIDHRQPECAETFFNYGVVPRFSHRTYFHNRCMFVRPAVVDRASSTPTRRRTAATIRAQHGLRARADRHRRSTSASSARFADFRARPAPTCWPRSAAALPRPVRARSELSRSRCCRALFFRNQHGVRRRARRQRLRMRIRSSCRSSTTPTATAVRRRAADRPRSSWRCCSPPTARTSWSTWRCRRRTSRSCAQCVPEQAPPPSSTRWSACRSTGKTLFFRDFLHHLQALDRPLHRRAGHQGPGDDRVHAAVVSVRVQGDPATASRRRRTPTAPGQAEVRAGQAPRPRRPDDRHPRVFGRGVSARPLHAGAARRSSHAVAPSQIEHRRRLRRRAPRLHRAAA